MPHPLPLAGPDARLYGVASHTGCFTPAAPPLDPTSDAGARVERTGGRAAILQCYEPADMAGLEHRHGSQASARPLSSVVHPAGTVPHVAASSSAPVARIALLCINPWNHAGELQPFSYGAFLVQAALVADARLAGAEVRVFEGRDWDADQWADEILAFDPQIVGASVYVWSLPALLPVLRYLRRARPEVWTVLGGPSARPAMLEHAPYCDAVDYVDAVVVSDDPTALADIAAVWPRGRSALASIPGLALARDGAWVDTEGVRPPRPTDARPSPFQLGITPPGLSAHLQSFVGCPMSCTFCAWGVEREGGVHSERYLGAELEAFARMGARSVMSVDAGLNLNRRAFEHLVRAQERVGFLSDVPFYAEVYPSLVSDELLEFLAATRSEIGVGLQSYDEKTLQLSSRRFRVERFEEVIERLQRVGPTTVEIILGLPGDTAAAFRRTLERVLAMSVAVRVYYCLVLPDALMTRAPASYRLRYDPISLELASCMSWGAEELAREVEHLNELVAARGGLLINQWPEPRLPPGRDGKPATAAAGRAWFLA